MVYAEIVVNVPIRRTFARRYAQPPPLEDVDALAPDGASDNGQSDDGAGALQSYHYHLPPELESRLQPGHLVWVPFGDARSAGLCPAPGRPCAGGDAARAAAGAAGARA